MRNLIPISDPSGSSWILNVALLESSIIITASFHVLSRVITSTLIAVNHHHHHVFIFSSKVMLQVLYKLKTAKVFERARGKEEKANTDIVDEDPFAIQTLSWCPESKMLCVAGVSAHVIVYRFSKQEITTEVVQVNCLGHNQQAE